MCGSFYIWPPTPFVVDGVEHSVVGAVDADPGVRDSVALRTFLLDAFKYALAASMKKYRRRASTRRRPKLEELSATPEQPARSFRASGKA